MNLPGLRQAGFPGLAIHICGPEPQHPLPAILLPNPPKDKLLRNQLPVRSQSCAESAGPTWHGVERMARQVKRAGCSSISRAQPGMDIDPQDEQDTLQNTPRGLVSTSSQRGKICPSLKRNPPTYPITGQASQKNVEYTARSYYNPSTAGAVHGPGRIRAQVQRRAQKLCRR